MPRILNINVSDIDKEALLNKAKSALLSNTKYHIVTANPEILLEAYRNEAFRNSIGEADIFVPDGVGLKYCAFFYGHSFRYPRIIGVDLTIDLLRMNDSLRKCTLIVGGTSSSVVQKATQDLALDDPEDVYIYADDNIQADNYHLPRIRQMILTKNVSLVVAALGHVKQELLISKLVESGIKCVFIGVGGTFDYLSGEFTRPNRIIRYLGFEWLYRLLSQPKTRFRRIMAAALLFPLYCISQSFIELFHVEQSGVDKQ